jgi:hypothetical protein
VEVLADPARLGEKLQIDIDRIEEWAPALARELAELLPPDLATIRATTRPELYSDARELLFGNGEIQEAALKCAEWIRSNSVLAYHGTRLDAAGQASILRHGLIRLDAAARADALRKRLSQHSAWGNREGEFQALIERMSGEDGQYGSREGQVHLCFSRANLLWGSNHYLVEGSEFDGHVARTMFGMEGQQLLREDSHPVLVKIALPGPAAIEAANPWGCRSGDLPNFVRDLLDLWSYRLFDEIHRPPHGVDSCLRFSSDLPPEWIVELELVNEADIMHRYRAPLP